MATADSWESVVKEVRLAIGDIKALQGDNGESSDEESFSFQQVDQSADKLRSTVAEARLLIADLENLGEIPLLDELDVRSEKMKDSYSLETKSLIDYATKRIIQIVLLVFALSIAFLLLGFSLRRKSRTTAQ